MSTISASLYCISRGWAVIPLHYPVGDSCSCKLGPLCGNVGKHPIPYNGSTAGTTDPEQIKKWWSQWPNANIGIVTGKISNLFVVDVDPRHDGDATLASVEAKNGELPKTVETVTGSGGRHILFRHPGGAVRNDSRGHLLGAGIDIRGEGGFIVAPGSRHACGGSYEWELEHHPSEIDVVDAPSWLIEKVVKVESAQTRSVVEFVTNDEDADRNNLIDAAKRYLAKCDAAISPGGGDQKTFSIAGHLLAFRANGKSLQSSDVADLMFRSEWNARCSPPWAFHELTLKVESASRNGYPRPIKEIHEPLKRLEGIVPDDCDPLADVPTLKPRRMSELQTSYPLLRTPIIDGLLRQAETMNIVGSPKSRKSFLACDLALSVASGTAWLDTFQTTQGRVLIIDNELDPSLMTQRIGKIAAARGLTLADYDDNLEIVSLRGQLQDIVTITTWVMENLKERKYDLIILDALYRLLPKGTGENDNADMTGVYNVIDRAALKLNSAFVIVHHTSKGNQSDKKVTDVGSGAGALSRCPDTHATVREHENQDTVVLDAVTRSWRPPEPVCLHWDYPIFNVDHNASPLALKKERPANAGEEWKGTEDTFAQDVVGPNPVSKETVIRKATDDYKLSQRNAGDWLKRSVENGSVKRVGNGTKGSSFTYFAPAGDDRTI